jgi:uncharacterized membrane protein YecN with MAPEG domain
MHVALICIALLGLLLFGLGLAVSLMRGRANTIIGHSPDPTDPLHKLVRAHGNTAEYAPLLAVLMLVVAMNEPATWQLWCMGIATACRYSIAVGMITSQSLAKAHPLRFVGALGTYVTGLVLSVGLLI